MTDQTNFKTKGDIKMINTINLELNKYEYEKRDSAARLGHAYSVKNEQGTTLSVNQISQYKAIEDALQEILGRLARDYKVADIIVTGATLTTNLQELLSDMYTVESQINSVTFE